MSDEEAVEVDFDVEALQGEFKGKLIDAPKIPRPMPGPPQPIGHRITVVEHVSHQTQGEEATSAKRTFTRKVESDEQVYSRRCKVDEEWTPLDTGWNKTYSMLYITNDEKRGEGPELELKFSTDNSMCCWSIPAGEPFRGSPKLGPEAVVVIRSTKGIARYTINAYPE